MNPRFPEFDLYDELEVAPHASAATIQAAYRALSKQHHPDTARDRTSAEAKMKRLNQAHDVLKDPATRAAYDAARWGRAGAKASGSGSAPPRGGGPAGGETRSQQTHRPSGLRCDRCGKAFKTPGGLAWHRANNRNCMR